MSREYKNGGPAMSHPVTLKVIAGVIAISGWSMIPGTEFARSWASLFEGAVLRMRRGKWKQDCKRTSRASYVSSPGKSKEGCLRIGAAGKEVFSV
jgi:hypothetical protein